MKTPWYIEILSFLGSLLAGGFFLLCLVVLGLLNNKDLNLFLGLVVMILVSVFSFLQTRRKKESFGPILFSFLNQGFCLFLFGFHETYKPEETSFLWLILCFQLIFFFFVSNPIQRFLSPILFFLFFGFLLLEYNLLYFLPFLTAICLSLLFCFSFPRNAPEPYHHLPYSLSISLLILVNFSFFPELKEIPWKRESQSIIFLLGGSYLLYKELLPKISIFSFLLFLVFFTFIFLPTVQTPGIIASFFIILLGFARGDSFLFYLAWISFFLFYFGYYYDLETNLLDKAKMMIGSSLLFFAAYLFLRFSPVREK
ncbi:DUF4401 domain-containing protein [Leptospira sp. 2 VSF19]|uniref:DUF4401 domain-containing protein n=1 Tax=Leptospira soteropolitanensis TaxID=2950025 RepID=A0AAW5VDV1_9LEPT|nr:DUF4401 domain-containing protein [Leptospira soteropolitanensis]MCW7493107.1 DUF4401 domain-containing protein [Leptospira soteropolitanensis]MCW7500824.1 DUF4401 domain-containing protein [Leptospira soteropolitanensis]MCW7522957.1 DUF4401 domain-containing protein [Leptospira soteropolitanensis]MCW7526936.1 DUF4401 domain-containing protein [Leptospira soteropolitanensis]MCW7530675.1 DUF4401 domain-containing protein [Leptospira soteropolitanensis]